MLITLQEGFDELMRKRAMTLCGLDRDALDFVLGARSAGDAVSRAEYMRKFMATDQDESQENEPPIGHEYWRDVQDTLDDLAEQFWLEVERDIDQQHRGGDHHLTLVDGIPENPGMARVTTTSLEQLIANKLGFPADTTGGDTAGEAENQPLARRDRYSAKMLVLAARDAISQDADLRKNDGSPNCEAIASRWLKQLTSNDHRTGLTKDNIARHISEGIDAM